jgi:hypothetical protein
MSKKNRDWVKILLLVYAALAIFASIQSISLGGKQFEDNGPTYTHYNNYLIFKQSFFHLINHQDLYLLFPGEQWDLFKYSPTFALFFGLFAALPDWLGLMLWNLLNALVFYLGLKNLPNLSPKTTLALLLFCGIEMMTSLQSAQSNALIVGLILLTFSQLEKRQYLWATLFILLTVYIKIFGIVAYVIFIFYPKKERLIGYSLLWGLILLLLPLPVTGVGYLADLYKSWLRLLGEDHTSSVGLSVLGWLQSWFGFPFSKNSVLLTGMALLVLPLIRVKAYQHYAFRLNLLASVLVWIVIFNHKAESPTFVIAVAGVAIWGFYQQSNPWHWALFLFALVFTQLSPTDLFPAGVREHWVSPYVLKAVPCILIWAKINYELLADDFSKKHLLLRQLKPNRQ